MVNTYRIRAFDSFATLRAAAPSLDSCDTRSDIFCTMAWFANLAQNGFEPGAVLQLMLAEQQNPATCLCLPLTYKKSNRQLSSLSNYYSSLFAPIDPADMAKNTPIELWRAMLRQMTRDNVSWANMTLYPLDTASPFFHAILEGLKAEAYWADSYFCFGNWYLEVAGRSFGAYFATLPSQLRNNILRGKKKLCHAGDWQITIQKNADAQLDAAIADFALVYAQSWKEPESFPLFIGSLCCVAAENGWLRLGILRLQGKPIAAQLWLVKDRRALIYKLAYATAQSHFSAGSVLSAALLEHVIDIDRVDEVDYLTGDDSYKSDWMSHRRERRGIVAFNPSSWRGVMAAGRHFIPKWSRAIWAKTTTPRSPARRTLD